VSHLRLRPGLLVALVALLVPTSASAAGNVVISQVYGGGGNSGAPLTHDFVELFNRSGSSVSLDGWSIQYASATGTGNFGANSGQLAPLSGSIAPGKYLLVQLAGGANGSPLPVADIVDSDGPINMSSTAGKVALASQATTLGCNGGSTTCSAAALAAIVDLVGYGNANFFEGAGAAPTLSNTLAAFRANGGQTDTDSNVADFASGTPAPRTSGSPPPPPPAAPFGSCGDDTETSISSIQGSGSSAALTGSRTIEGVVVGDYQGAGQFQGYFVQEEVGDQDTDTLTSEGIFVFSGSSGGVPVDNVSVGEVVRVRGNAGEFGGMTQLSSINALEKCGTGSVPATPVSLPVANVGDHERYEGMLVQYAQTLTATEVFNLGRFGEVLLSGVGRLYTPTAVAEPGAPAQAVMAENARSRIVLDDASNTQNNDPTLYPQGGLSATNTLRVGDTLPGLTGILEFRFSAYRIQPVGPVAFEHTNLRPAAPAAVGGNLKIASFNVLNYFDDLDLPDGSCPTCRGAESELELERQEAKIASALKAIDADIVGLMEIENDGGPGNALADLTAALNAATAPGTYAYVDTGVIGTDAIKVALIYKRAAVTPLGDWKILTSAVDPRFDDTRNRPALAQTFRHLGSGEALTVVVNHLKSKGSACAGDPDTGDGSGNCNVTRTLAAAALADWLATDPTGSGDPDVMIIGDLNSYTFESPIATLEAKGYTNLVRKYGGLTAYSYVFRGESGYLDHALATSSLEAQVTGATEWHINPDEPTVLDYNVNFKSANHVNTLYDDGPYRSSDHDPVIVGVQLDVSYANLCALTRSYVENEGIANALCAKLAAAEAAAARGNENAKNGSLGAYVNQLEAQSGKSIPADAAAWLAALAGAL